MRHIQILMFSIMRHCSSVESSHVRIVPLFCCYTMRHTKCLSAAIIMSGQYFVWELITISYAVLNDRRFFRIVENIDVYSLLLLWVMLSSTKCRASDWNAWLGITLFIDMYIFVASSANLSVLNIRGSYGLYSLFWLISPFSFESQLYWCFCIWYPCEK